MRTEEKGWTNFRITYAFWIISRVFFILIGFICLAAQGSMEPREPGARHDKGVSPRARGHGCIGSV